MRKHILSEAAKNDAAEARLRHRTANRNDQLFGQDDPLGMMAGLQAIQTTGKVQRLEARIAAAESGQGWNSTCDVYNRDWKKELAALRRELRQVKKEQRK